MKDHESVPMLPIRRGQGVWLEDYDGKRYLDAISSWWVNLFGHAHPAINAALKDQLDTLEHVIFAGFTHAPAIELAEKLTQLAPPGLTRCFFTDNGSTAIEAALKMSFHYWRNVGQHTKTRFITLTNSYHGETLGALGIGDVELYKQTYRPLLIESIKVPSPDCYNKSTGETDEAYSERMFVYMEAALAHHAGHVCAVVIEPLVQCAGGMRMYHPNYLSKLRAACDHYHVHLIADEIAVGFGRTGTLFACEQAAITPDFLCLGKGLTGGYLPLATVLTHDTIYAAFYDDYATLKAFLHSHSYTGNPLACRAALATLNLFATLNTIEANRTLSTHLAHALAPLAGHPHVADIRQRGMIAAIELVKNKQDRLPFPWQERRGLRVYQHGLQHGVLLRPLGNVIYFMPPYVITPDEIDLMVRVATKGIDAETQ